METLPTVLPPPGDGDARHTLPAGHPPASLPVEPSIPEDLLREHARGMTLRWQNVPASSAHATILPQRLKAYSAQLDTLLATAAKRVSGKDLTPELELLESGRMLKAVLTSSEDAVPAFEASPHVQVVPGKDFPRIDQAAEAYLAAVGGVWSPRSLAQFMEEAQRHTPLSLAEVLLLPQALKLAQLGFIIACATEAFAAGALPPIQNSPFSAPLHSLRRLNQFEWQSLLESLIPFQAILQEDPAAAFAAMDEETRNTYYRRVAELAKHANHDEVATAREALSLAQRADQAGDPDPRRARRKTHIGYYLFAEGLPLLKRNIGYHAPLHMRPHDFLRRHNEDFYVFGVIVLSILIIALVVAPLVPYHNFWAVMAAMLLVLLPATGGAVDLVNGFVHWMFKAESLPRLDFLDGLPQDAKTLVVVPTLLLREQQVRELFEDLETHYLSNEDPNLHFALLTDLPDSRVQPPPDEQQPLLQLAVRLTDDLNRKYANGSGGAFLLLHRHRVYNARQGVWMGWERKRGKLLDLNKLLLYESDNFPVKSGPREALRDIRYVITLDSDTKLPRSTAARLVGTIAHPLNSAIIDPRKRIVTLGYGILQPRVGISVASASRSKLAAIYSGDTGFDIYTRAVSDVYQDLFGEGIFTGKGIYEVNILHQVLERRFPRDSLLSHDLIEGAYARAGLVTDLEMIDDYPSHYDAHIRRRHRWIRGDWQILRWLFSPVPDEAGHMVPNPISLISQWKIFDNLRRSLIEPLSFIVLVLGWFVLPGGALYWTLVTLLLLLLPAVVQLFFDLVGALLRFSLVPLREAIRRLATSITFAVINLTFLPHYALMSLDAIVRVLIRTLFSGRYLLEWETAAQAESNRDRTVLNVYLGLSPVIALVLGSGLWLTRPRALAAAGPVLALWLIAPLAARWLSASPGKPVGTLNGAEHNFLLRQAALLWRFYAEFGGPENHWLIPDNVEERDTRQDRKLSPTNLGMLLNARQAACELGFLTLPEFAAATLGTLGTYERLEKLNGHIFNWYDIETLRPIPPLVISSVDSGNLAASFYTLHSGALDLLKRPLLEGSAFLGLEMLEGGTADAGRFSLPQRLRRLFEEYAGAPPAPSAAAAADADTWLLEERQRRAQAIIAFVDRYLPWLRPEFDQLQGLDALRYESIRSLEHAAAFGEALRESLAGIDAASPLSAAAQQLQARLPAALEHLSVLHADVTRIIAQAEQFAEAMDYRFLFVESRQLLSIGYDGGSSELLSSCYDLLASESRIATFLAVAKGDIPQQSWFRLDRSHVLVGGHPALVSWTGTMFEYMMPNLWMRTFPNTLLANSLESAVRIQREHVRKIPWGISESGFVARESDPRYGYQAWGIPGLALKYGAQDGPVISPYSTFLALPLLRRESLANLRRMVQMGWVGAYGFYEAADYSGSSTPGRESRRPARVSGEPELVRSWMAHHQGMALLAATNVLRENVFQRWFHATPRVRAAELLLNEKALSHATLTQLEENNNAVQEPAAA